MPTKRTPLDRPRKARIDAETLALFTELEAVPLRERHSPEFKQRDRELHERLGLSSEWFCMVCSVTSRERQSYSEPGMPVHEAWHKVREVRLLAMDPLPERRLLTGSKLAA
jgi:hypothetical protein